MKFEHSFEDFINFIRESSYKDIIKLLPYWFPYYIQINFIHIEDFEENNVKKISSEIQTLIKDLVKKILENFGNFSSIIKYCLNNYYDIGDYFYSKSLKKKIKDNFYFCKKDDVSKFLNRKSNEDNPKIKKLEGSKYVILQKI